MVFQNYALYPHMTVLKNLTLAPMKLHHKSKQEAEELYRAFGKVWQKLPEGWRTLVLSSHTEFERTFGCQAVKKRKLYNGMIKCDVFMYGNV